MYYAYLVRTDGINMPLLHSTMAVFGQYPVSEDPKMDVD